MVAENLAIELLGKFLTWIKEKWDGQRDLQEIEALVSEGYRELLSGTEAGLYRVRYIIARLDALGDFSPAGIRLRDGYASAAKAAPTRRRRGGAGPKKAAAKKPAKKAAAKKTPAKKATASKKAAKSAKKTVAAKSVKKTAKKTAAKKSAAKKSAAKK